MGRYKLEIHRGISEFDIKKIVKYAKILDSNDLLEIYIYNQNSNFDVLGEHIFKDEFDCNIIKDIEKDNKFIKYIKLTKKE